MTEPISIKELISVVLKSGKRMVCLCLVLAVLAGGLQIYMQWDYANSTKRPEEEVELEYQNALQQYEARKAQLETVLNSTQEYVSGHRKYMDTSVLMRIDATSRPTSQMELKVSNVTQSQVRDLAGIDLTETVSQMYVTAWSDADLAEKLTDHPYTYLGTLFVREMVSVTYSPETGMLRIRADAENTEASRLLCDAAYRFLLTVRDRIEEEGFIHSLDVQSRYDGYYNDDSLWKNQAWRVTEIQKAQEECDAYRYELELLVAPVKESTEFKINVSKVALWVVLGAVMGALLIAAVAVAQYIGSDYIGGSRQMAGVLGIPYLGSVMKVEGFWNRLAARVSDEPFWSEPEAARQYLVENIAARVPENARITLASTREIAEDDAMLQPVIQMLTDRGYTVTFVNQAYCNAETVRAFRDSDYAVLVEIPGKTSRVAATGVKELAEQLCGSVPGFLFV